MKKETFSVTSCRPTPGGAFIINNLYAVRGTDFTGRGLIHPMQIIGKTITVIWDPTVAQQSVTLTACDLFNAPIPTYEDVELAKLVAEATSAVAVANKTVRDSRPQRTAPRGASGARNPAVVQPTVNVDEPPAVDEDMGVEESPAAKPTGADSEAPL